MAIIMLCKHTSRSLKGSTLRQNGHLKSATAAVAETSAPLWVNLAQKLRSSADQGAAGSSVGCTLGTGGADSKLCT